jgi:Holliday junction resolvase
MNQRRGYDAELKVMHELDSRGYIAIRSARSRGPFDVFGLGEEGALCVQVKRTKNESLRWQKAEIQKMMKFRAMQRPTNRLFLWCWVDRKGWFIQELFKDGSTVHGWGLDWINMAPVIQHKIDLTRDEDGASPA